MIQELQMRVDPRTAANPMMLTAEASRLLDIDANRIKHLLINRRSVDARQRKIMINLSAKIFIDKQPADDMLAVPVSYTHIPQNTPVCIVVGAGPAGLFAALRLIELGIKPVILERGKDVDARRKDMAGISRKGIVDPDSNYCFGEGGAGAYSDGKLYTRSKKRGPVDKILNILYQNGAPRSVLIEAHPHIGTDLLPEVIKSIRNTIINCGGEVHFQTKVTGLLVDNNTVKGVVTQSGETFCGPVILATGHSARDVYRFLHDSGIALEPKGIAVGVRLEHPQQLIDKIRYHAPRRPDFLPPADYSMLTRVDGRAVYSFCMCPGGVIIPAASQPGQMVVNGMSNSKRSGRWANSGMVVEILPDDIPERYNSFGPLKMMEFQADIEKKFFEDSGNGSQNAPAQRMDDFVKGRPSATLPPVSYAPGVHPARIDKLLPPFIATRLQKGFEDFNRKNRGFLTNEAVLIGDETRTSAPVRIPREPDTLRHITLNGLFPCGEGAGYAGGIVSAAIDGDRCATAAASLLKSSSTE